MAITSFNALRYPQGLGSDQYPNYVTFTPMIMKYGGTEQLSKGTNAVGFPGSGSPSGGTGSPTPTAQLGNPEAVLGNLQAGLSGVSGTISSMVNAADAAAGNIKAGSSPLKEIGKLVGRIGQISGVEVGVKVNGSLNNALKTAKDVMNSAGSISLYLPDNLETNSSVDYETAALGGIGMQAVQVASQVDKQDLVNSLGQLTAGAFQDMISSGNRRAVIGIASGQVTNNFSFQVFNSVLHRQFAYEFRMMAKNGVETATIKRICDMFQYYMLPARKNEGNIGFYEVPCQWKIEYKRKGNRLEYHQQPRNCFLQSVDVGYGGDPGNSTYNDGGPMEVTLRLQFVEIEPLYREGGYFNDNEVAQNIRGQAGSESNSKSNISEGQVSDGYGGLGH